MISHGSKGRHNRRVAVYWPCQFGEDQHYFFGLINVTLFGIIFFQIQRMPACYYRCFSLPRIFTVGMVVATNQSERGGVENSLVAIAKALSWLAVCVVSIGLMTVFTIRYLHF